MAKGKVSGRIYVFSASSTSFKSIIFASLYDGIQVIGFKTTSSERGRNLLTFRQLEYWSIGIKDDLHVLCFLILSITPSLHYSINPESQKEAPHTAFFNVLV
jgi:hypothetical protein